MAQLKLTAMSALLTALVWVSADQLLSESATFKILLEPFAAGGGACSVGTPEGRPQTYQVTLRGPQKAIARFKEAGPLSVPIPIDTHATGDVGIEADRVGEGGSRTAVLELKPPPAKESGEIIEDEDTNETVEKIVAWLDERKLI